MRLERLRWLRFWLWWLVPLLLAFAVVAYGYFALAILLEKNEGWCVYGLKRDGDLSTAVEIREGFVPLEYTCTFADGTVEHRVHLATNVVVAGALTGAAACAVTAVRLGRRIGRAAASSAPA